jgi:tripartite-type tricarboxylate transporter receptor subunit TctC
MNIRHSSLIYCRCLAWVACLATWVATSSAWAQQFPSKPVTLVVPFAAGGAADLTARRLAERMTAILNQPVLVDNKPCAGGFVAALTVLGAPRDGHSLLFAGTNTMSLTPLAYKKLPFGAEDLIPLTSVSKQPFTVNASPLVPTGSMEQFLAYARSKPEGITVGTTGIGTAAHFLAEWIGETLEIKIRTVPYKGVAQGALDLMAGRLDVQVDGMSSGVTMHTSGKTRLLAGMGRERSMLPSGVLNFSDMGYPNLVAYAEFGIMAPKGPSETTLKKIFETISQATKHPDFIAKLASSGEIAAASASPADYVSRIKSEKARWMPIVRRLNIELD